MKIGYLLPLNSQLKFYSEIEKGKPLEPGKYDQDHLTLYLRFSFSCTGSSVMLYMIQENAEDFLFIVSSFDLPHYQTS